MTKNDRNQQKACYSRDGLSKPESTEPTLLTDNNGYFRGKSSIEGATGIKLPDTLVAFNCHS